MDPDLYEQTPVDSSSRFLWRSTVSTSPRIRATRRATSLRCCFHRAESALKRTCCNVRIRILEVCRPTGGGCTPGSTLRFFPPRPSRSDVLPVHSGCRFPVPDAGRAHQGSVRLHHAAKREFPADQLAHAETVLTIMLAEVMHVERVPPDSNFFDDLGADSLVMAHFCARVRCQAPDRRMPDLPPISMRDIYRGHRAGGARGCRIRPHRIARPSSRRGSDTGQHGPVRPLRDPAIPVLPRIHLHCRSCRRLGLRLDPRQLESGQ